MTSVNQPDAGSAVVPPGAAVLSVAARAVALARYEVLAPHLHDEVPLAHLVDQQHQTGGASRDFTQTNSLFV